MSERRGGRTIGLICAVVAAIAGITFYLRAQEQKQVPDHTGFKECQPCHADKQTMWEASGHSKALSAVAGNSKASADCYACHSTEGFAAKLQNQKPDMNQKEGFHTVSCLACHDPRAGKYRHGLAMDPEELCSVCHTQGNVLKGKGARRIEDTRSFHTAVPCVSCHMTGGNHRMKIIRPDDPELPESSTDTCTACHKDNNRKGRARQIQEWQSEYKEKMDAIQADLNVIGDALKEKPDLLNEDLKKKLGDARFNIGILQRDGSRGAHNFDYTIEILNLAANDVKEIKAAMK
jgi:predicted CXXCH cytochrome family protein